jgi:hypothetical protein
MHDHIKKLLDRFYATKDLNTRFSPTNLVTSEAQTLYDILFAVSFLIIYLGSSAHVS